MARGVGKDARFAIKGPMRSSRLTTFILVGLVIGIAAGYVCNSAFPEDGARFSALTSLLPGAFLRLIKMIISPLVFSTLVVGIAKMGDITTVGRIGGKALGWFIFASLVSLTLGLVMVGCSSLARRCTCPSLRPTPPRESRPRACRSKRSSRMRFRRASSMR
jgi:L-cystine uptake protein TcyP (sodium:dicarboxylate symporter family)